MSNTITTHTRNTNSVFTTKEEYVAFRKHWKTLHAAGYHKPERVEYEGGYVWDSAYKKYEQVPGGYRMTSPLTAWHHLVFNLAIGRTPPVKAFGDRSERKSTWNKPPLFWNIYYGKKDFSVFGDTLTEEQKAELKSRVDAYLGTL